jgi:hypothetical protein
MKPEKRRAKAIAACWLRFEIAAPKLAAASSADDPVYDEVLDHLHAVEPRLYFEFCNSEQPCELIITADGDPDLFAAAREVVAHAPVSMDGKSGAQAETRLPRAHPMGGRSAGRRRPPPHAAGRDGSEDLGFCSITASARRRPGAPSAHRGCSVAT